MPGKVSLFLARKLVRVHVVVNHKQIPGKSYITLRNVSSDLNILKTIYKCVMYWYTSIQDIRLHQYVPCISSYRLMLYNYRKVFCSILEPLFHAKGKYFYLFTNVYEFYV